MKKIFVLTFLVVSLIIPSRSLHACMPAFRPEGTPPPPEVKATKFTIQIGNLGHNYSNMHEYIKVPSFLQSIPKFEDSCGPYVKYARVFPSITFPALGIAILGLIIFLVGRRKRAQA